jgi:hypothetical protein
MWRSAVSSVSINASNNGVGMLVAGEFAVKNVLVEVQLEGRVGFLPAVVRHATPTADNLIHVGLEFESRESEEAEKFSLAACASVEQAIDVLLTASQFDSLPTDDRRVHQRVRYNEKIGVKLGPGRSLTAFARDLSKGGMAFVSTSRITEPEVTIELPNRKLGFNVSILATVVRCFELSEDLYDVGVKFLRIQ